MQPVSISLGAAPLHLEAQQAEGRFVDLEGQPWYCIENVDRMPPFLMSLVSDSDHWMFVSSRGGLTAGRRNAESSLFPYTTDDRVHDCSGRRGPVTHLLVQQNGGWQLWEPFRDAHAGLYRTVLRLYKNTAGDRLLFEEHNQSLDLTFQYEWASSEAFGWVRRARLINHGGTCQVRILDGLLDLLPSGVDSAMQTSYSALVNAYKRCEAEANQLAIYRLSSVPVDQAEPSESLAANTVWSTGLPGAKLLLSERQIQAFRQGQPVESETDIKGQRGAYLLSSEVELEDRVEWTIVAEVDQDTAQVRGLRDRLATGAPGAEELQADIEAGTQHLQQLVGRADGAQCTADPREDARHFANTLFNIMRGGVFEHGVQLPGDDLRAYVREVAPLVAEKHQGWLQDLPAYLGREQALAGATAQDDPDLVRLINEYLPLIFSRRHGDPSRPWNVFSIEVRQNQRGASRYAYAGNWRDIFQNWEALCASYPSFLPAVVARFVNASTADGYNPYRLTRSGFEWEKPDPNDPWAYIGYWGDHQVVYLFRLLDLWQRHDPEQLSRALLDSGYVFANVPYRIAAFERLREHPQDTITYDVESATSIERRAKTEGQEASLLRNTKGELQRATLLEKLLLPLLVKLTNLAPEVGIWLNTQRPEWNDANNALVGHGASVVTLCHMRLALVQLQELLPNQNSVQLTTENANLMARVTEILERHRSSLQGPLPPELRHSVWVDLGQVGSEHRKSLYAYGPSGNTENVSLVSIRKLLELAEEWITHSIRANRRDDGLYHGYNLMDWHSGNLGVRRLPIQLEGQVAALSSALLSPEEASDLLDALRSSDLYRDDQQSYLLYPARELPRFLERNVLPGDAGDRAPVLAQLVDANDTSIVVKSPSGELHFAPALRNAECLAKALDELVTACPEWSAAVDRDRAVLLALYEQLFDHAAFTGRSGTFYGYEGLGCIYWHQVSKLLLAVQESLTNAAAAGTPSERLGQHYLGVRQGLGTRKSPVVFGAFPTDPYSHTPAFAGAQQPGMTGQVKEDFLSRLGELGLEVRGGRITFDRISPVAFDWLESPGVFRFEDASGQQREEPVPAGCVAWTLYQVPMVLHRGGEPSIEVLLTSGERVRFEGHELGSEHSQALFRRDGSISRLDVYGR